MKYIYILLCTVFILTFTACGSEKAPEPKQANTQTNYTNIKQSKNADGNQEVNSIDDVLDKIYENNIIAGIEKAKKEDMEDTFGFDMSYIDEYYVRYSAKNYGLADIFVIKTDEDHQQDVFETLTKIKEDRVEQFQNYIIYDSLDIAKKAEIYTKGDYVIMIMVKNQEEAKVLLDNFLTEEE